MSCTTLSVSGIDARCDTARGGIKEIYVTDRASIDAGTPSAGILSSLALTTSGTKMKPFRFRKNQASMSSVATIDAATGNTFYTTIITINFAKIDAAKRVAIQAMLAGGAAVIAKDNNNLYWYLGYDDVVDCIQADYEWGTANTDANQIVLGLQDISNEAPYNVDEDCITTSLVDGL